MPEVPENLLYGKPKNLPKKKVVFYRRSEVSMDEFRAMSHAEQMSLDRRLDVGLSHELHPDPEFDKPYWVSKRKPKA